MAKKIFVMTVVRAKELALQKGLRVVARGWTKTGQVLFSVSSYSEPERLYRVEHSADGFLCPCRFEKETGQRLCAHVGAILNKIDGMDKETRTAYLTPRKPESLVQRQASEVVAAKAPINLWVERTPVSRNMADPSQVPEWMMQRRRNV